MSKLKLRVAGLAFLAFAFLALNGQAASAITYCIDVVAYGTNPATGECRQFPNPCSVPAGWTISYQGCAS